MSRDEVAERGFPPGPAPLHLVIETVNALFEKVAELEKRIENLESDATKIP